MKGVPRTEQPVFECAAPRGHGIDEPPDQRYDRVIWSVAHVIEALDGRHEGSVFDELAEFVHESAFSNARFPGYEH